MKFLICPASQDQIEPGDYTLFKGQDGCSYNYQVEFFEDDMVKITDSIGRYVPLQVDEIPSLINMLVRINNYQKDKLEVQVELVKELLSGASF